MILIDTGPLVALFDPRDTDHADCRERLRGIRQTLFTTMPVLTETFHILSPGSHGAMQLMTFLRSGGVKLYAFEADDLRRAFDLMTQYRDHPMDLADASVIVAAERLQTLKVFTLDLNDFNTYRIRRGQRLEPAVIV